MSLVSATLTLTLCVPRRRGALTLCVAKSAWRSSRQASCQRPAPPSACHALSAPTPFVWPVNSATFPPPGFPPAIAATLCMPRHFCALTLCVARQLSDFPAAGLPASYRPQARSPVGARRRQHRTVG
eukprot:218336-Chlamydomonas_euryale.AAC.2